MASSNTSLIEPKTDFIGQEIKVGDRVITHYTAGYAGLRWATVDALLPKMVRIEITTDYGKKN